MAVTLCMTVSSDRTFSFRTPTHDFIQYNQKVAYYVFETGAGTLVDTALECITHNVHSGDTMKTSTKNHITGTFHEASGKAKEIAGILSDNPKLEAEGIGEKIAGKVQIKMGQIEKVLGK